MAGNGWDSRHANNMHGLDLARQELYTSRIACRICGRIFMSDKALFDHLELHLLLDEDDARRKVLLSHSSSSQRTLPASHFDQTPVPVLPTETNPFSIGTSNTRNLDLQSSTAAPSPVSFGSTNNYMAPLIRTQQPTAYGVATQILLVPQPRNQCFTRPFLNQLEASLLVEGMASIVEKEVDHNSGDDETLDVTLKL